MARDDPGLSRTDGVYQGTRISTGSDLVDKTLQGGIPLGSVCLVEGPSGSGKGVFCQHLVFGSLLADLLVVYYVSNEDHQRVLPKAAREGPPHRRSRLDIESLQGVADEESFFRFG